MVKTSIEVIRDINKEGITVIISTNMIRLEARHEESEIKLSMYQELTEGEAELYMSGYDAFMALTLELAYKAFIEEFNKRKNGTE